MRPAIVILHAPAMETARHIQAELAAEIHAPEGIAGADVHYTALAGHLRGLFLEGCPILAVMAAGAVIRILAPSLSDKRSEPAVLAISEDGRSIVPLLGGHRGANDMARRLAGALHGHAAVTTAGDTRFGVALDAPPCGWRLENPQDAKPAMAALLAGASARITAEADWLTDLPVPRADDAAVTLSEDDAGRAPHPGELLYRPQRLVLGMGAERGAPADEAIALAEEALRQAGVSPLCLAMVATLDVKADEASLNAVAAHFQVPLRVFDAATLEAETPRLATPSDIVYAEVGCHGVAEGAALAAGGPDAALILPKVKSRRVTAAIARAPRPLSAPSIGRARGRLTLVGIGPGAPEWRSPEARAAIEAADDRVGYGLYLDLVADIPGTGRRHDFPLGAEEDRVRHALLLAAEGRTVALVCSGDAGIYAMATLAYELIDTGELPDAARRVEVVVCPGISALQAAAARAGAPLGHDFCTISLSDLLTPWPDIERRVRAAAEGDFVIAFYNPVSRRRRSQLADARAILLEHRPAQTPVVLATNLGRPGETVRIVSLADLRVDDVDMLTVVIVGSSQTRRMRTGDGREHAYTPRGYAGKAGSALTANATRERA
ncbi:precorrin-3 methyltransferase [Aureimonas altamirensis DSM 21988]|uniref:Precorrin-3 methyltransferase n=1 Tax=Aureimonas altamirensis DSM 21988 TaxID=1121026 RepID=A0ABY1INZ5_9HYPH|nr:precorrin-3B C(17)-methyltransferase [Aureimonas altamirensis]SHJ72145.1 precorrin-3 methyltransferase [Aureimonas altamirensis DSM 21988]